MMAIASRRHYYTRKFALQLRESCTNFCQEDEDVGKQRDRTTTGGKRNLGGEVKIQEHEFGKARAEGGGRALQSQVALETQEMAKTFTFEIFN